MTVVDLNYSDKEPLAYKRDKLKDNVIATLKAYIAVEKKYVRSES